MPGSDLNEVMVNRESYKYSGQWPKLFAKQLCMVGLLSIMSVLDMLSCSRHA